MTDAEGPMPPWFPERVRVLVEDEERFATGLGARGPLKVPGPPTQGIPLSAEPSRTHNRPHLLEALKAARPSVITRSPIKEGSHG